MTSASPIGPIEPELIVFGTDETGNEADCIQNRAEEHDIGRGAIGECKNWSHRYLSFAIRVPSDWDVPSRFARRS